MINTKFILTKTGKLNRRPSKTIPDQSLTIAEIVKRYMRGIPVDVIQRNPVYSDHNEYDLEKMSRLDFGEKSAMANELQANAQNISDELNERAQQVKDAKKKKFDAKKAEDQKGRGDSASIVTT